MPHVAAVAPHRGCLTPRVQALAAVMMVLSSQ